MTEVERWKAVADVLASRLSYSSRKDKNVIIDEALKYVDKYVKPGKGKKK